MNERTDVLCGCGWGLLGIPLEEAPDHCPVCGFSFLAFRPALVWSSGNPSKLVDPEEN